MSLISWLGLGFVAFLAIGGIVALGNTAKEIHESDMDEDSKRRWGFLMGFSPCLLYTSPSPRDRG